MKEWLQKVHSNPNSQRAIDWIKLIGITGSAQIIIQIIGFVCGILVIRTLSTDEYALYTVANTMLGTLVVLSDGGIGSGAMAQSSLVWKNKDKLGEVVVTGLNLRKKMVVFTSAILIPFVFYLLTKNGATWGEAILLILVLIPCLMAQLSGSLLTIPAYIHQDIKALQKIQLLVSILRLSLLTLLIFLFPFAFLAILPSGITQMYGNIKLRKKISVYTDLKRNSSLEVQKKLIKFVKKTLPEAIYYCLSGQLTIWILAIFGSTDSVADIGALGRIAMLLVIIQSIYSTLIVPRFARLENSYNLIVKRFFSIQVFILVLLATVIIFVYFFATEILWILGPYYYGLEKEILLVMIGSCLNVFSGLTYLTCLTKEWVINPLIFITISIITIVIGVLLLDVSTLYGILVFNILIAAVQVIMNCFYAYYKIFKLKTV